MSAAKRKEPWEYSQKSPLMLAISTLIGLVIGGLLVANIIKWLWWALLL